MSEPNVVVAGVDELRAGVPGIRSSWIVMGPEPALCTCLRCGATLAKPDGPMKLSLFIEYMESWGNPHRSCELEVSHA